MNAGGSNVLNVNDVINAVGDPIFVKDEEHRFVLVNDSLCALVGHPRSELIGKTDDDFFPREQASVFRKTDDKVLATGGESNVEVTFTDHRTGKAHTAVTHKTRYVAPSGKRFVVGVVRDITERKRSEEELKEREERLRLKLDTILSPDYDLEADELRDIINSAEIQSLMDEFYALTKMPIYILDMKGNHVVATGWQDICTKFHRSHPDAAKNCLESDIYMAQNVKPGEFLIYKCKNSMWDVVTPIMIGDKQVGNLYFGQFFYDDEVPDVAAFEKQAERYGFDTKEYLAALARVPRWSRERVEHVMKFYTKFAAMISNLSYSNLKLAKLLQEQRRAEAERLEMERRLLHAQKLESLGVLAGGIAHDFNNLLTAILGNMDLALDAISPLSPARRSIDDAIHATKRAEGLTRQMLAYSGKGQFIVDDMDLSELVEENSHLLKAAISKGTTLNLHLDRRLPLISADAGQIQQVVMNLITNASESLGEKPGVVAISTGAMECDRAYLSRSRAAEKPAPGRFVWLEVTDTGCGMDEETQERLFDPFFTTKLTGRGLGMSAVLGIVRGHKGAIVVKSGVGKGTTIQVLFPVSAAPAAAPPPAGNIPQGRDRTTGKPPLSGTVLVVDDEQIVRAPCAAMVEHMGYRVLTAASGDEAVSLFRAHADEIVCVILDLTMPRMDGVETFEALRSIRPGVRVILSSGYNEREAMERFSGRGLAGFVKKPYGLKSLSEILNHAITGA